MGLFQSQPSVTRSDVQKLIDRFQKVSDRSDTLLPWITFCKTGGVALTILGAGNMFMRSVTLYSLGGEVAAQLILVGLLLLTIGPIFLQCVLILNPAKALLDRFFEVIPKYMDNSCVPEMMDLSPAWVIPILIDFYAFTLCPQSDDSFSFWYLFISMGLLVMNGVLFLFAITENNNSDNLQTTCRACIKTLQGLLRANVLKGDIDAKLSQFQETV